jgi:hypothetical protein
MSASETQDGDGGCLLWNDLDEDYRRPNLRSLSRRAVRPLLFTRGWNNCSNRLIGTLAAGAYRP